MNLSNGMVSESRPTAGKGICPRLRFCGVLEVLVLAGSFSACAHGNDLDAAADGGGGVGPIGDGSASFDAMTVESGSDEADGSPVDFDTGPAPGTDGGPGSFDANYGRDAGQTGEDASGPSLDSGSPMDASDVDAAVPADAALDAGLGDAAAFDAAASDAGSGRDAACAESAPMDYCAAIPRLASSPNIDGVLDCGPALVPVSPAGWNGSAALPSGNGASLATAWRPDGIYVFAQITAPAAVAADPGSPPFDGAGAEVFLDSDGLYPNAPQYDNPGTIQLVAAAPVSATASARNGEGYRNAADQGAWSSTQFGTFATPEGFVFEAFVSAGDLGLTTWSLASGAAVGFDLAINVSFATASQTGAQGHRNGQYFLHVGTASVGAPYDDPRAFCTPTLE